MRQFLEERRPLGALAPSGAFLILSSLILSSLAFAQPVEPPGRATARGPRAPEPDAPAGRGGQQRRRAGERRV